ISNDDSFILFSFCTLTLSMKSPSFVNYVYLFISCFKFSNSHVPSSSSMYCSLSPIRCCSTSCSPSFNAIYSLIILSLKSFHRFTYLTFVIISLLSFIICFVYMLRIHVSLHRQRNDLVVVELIRSVL